MDHELVEPGARLGVRSRREQIRHGHGRIRARQLITVNAVRQPRHRRHRLDDFVRLGGVLELPRVGELGVVLPDLVEPGMIRRTRDRQVVQRALLVRVSVRVHRHAVRSFGQGAQVPHERLVPNCRRADRVPDD